MDMDGSGGDRGQESFEDTQLNAFIRNVITPTQKLHSLCLYIAQHTMVWSRCKIIAGAMRAPTDRPSDASGW